MAGVVIHAHAVQPKGRTFKRSTISGTYFCKLNSKMIVGCNERELIIDGAIMIYVGTRPAVRQGIVASDHLKIAIFLYIYLEFRIYRIVACRCRLFVNLIRTTYYKLTIKDCITTTIASHRLSGGTSICERRITHWRYRKLGTSQRISNFILLVKFKARLGVRDCNAHSHIGRIASYGELSAHLIPICVIGQIARIGGGFYEAIRIPGKSRYSQLPLIQIAAVSRSGSLAVVVPSKRIAICRLKTGHNRCPRAISLLHLQIKRCIDSFFVAALIERYLTHQTIIWNASTIINTSISYIKVDSVSSILPNHKGTTMISVI